MNDFRWSFKRHFIISLLITIVTILSDFLTGGFAAFSVVFSTRLLRSINMNEATSIGIIGGADGPTAIFLSGNPFNMFIISKTIFFLVLLVLFVPTKNALYKMINN